jgi:hypothetical protein
VWTFGLFSGLVAAWGKAEINTVETLKLSWDKAKNGLIFGLIFGLIGGLVLGLIICLDLLTSHLGRNLTNEPTIRRIFLLLTRGLIIGIMIGLNGGLINGLIGSEIGTKTIPNQGIHITVMNAGIIGLITWLIAGIILVIYQNIKLTEGLFLGLFFGLIAVIFGGGKACIQHLTLRLILYAHGYMPWNYARFLDYATDRIFLQKVGGGYIFIHRLLLEHFAQMKLDQLDNRPL